MTAEEGTKLWIEMMVIGLGLCPFASKVVVNNEIKFTSTKSSDLQSLTALMMQHAEHILDNDTSDTTAIITIEKGLDSFTEYLDVIHLLEDHLHAVNLDSDVQIASFHPEYQFADTQPSDITNFTNRSPYPLIHILRCDDVAAAIENHPDIKSVPVHNMNKLTEVGKEGLASIYSIFAKH